MKIEDGYLIIEPGDDSTILGTTQTDDGYSGVGGLHWGLCGIGAVFHETRSTYYYRRPIEKCSPYLLSLVGGGSPLDQHFI